MTVSKFLGLLCLLSAVQSVRGGGTAVTAVILQGLDPNLITYLTTHGSPVLLDYFVRESVDYYLPVPWTTGRIYIGVQPFSGEVCTRLSWFNLTLGGGATSSTPLQDFSCGGSSTVNGNKQPYIMSADLSHANSGILFIHVSAVTGNVTYEIGYAPSDPGLYYDSVSLDHIWWTRSADYVFLDRILLMVLIGAAIFFEVVHVVVQNCVRKRSTAHFSMKLWNQINAEFMVLGFIAFLVWIIQRSGGLDLLVKGWAAPNNAADMLHFIEDVHMRLFTSMILYFIVMTWVVWNSTWYMRKWAVTEEEIQFDMMPEEQYTSRVKREFVVMHKKFNTHLYPLKIMDPVTKTYLSDEQKRRFNFAAYLNKTLEKLLMEMVSIKIVSWIGTAVVTMCVGVICKYVASITNYGVFWTMMGIELFILLILLVLAAFVEISYRKVVTGTTWAKGCIAKCGMFANESVLARFIQISMFYGCYTLLYFASSADARIYFKGTSSTLVPGISNKAATLGPFLGVYIFAFFIVNVVIVPLFLPRFNVVFRTPPFLDSHEKRQIIRIIYGRYHTAFFPRLFKKTHKEHRKNELVKFLYANQNQTWKKVHHYFESSSNSYSGEHTASLDAELGYSDGDELALDVKKKTALVHLSASSSSSMTSLIGDEVEFNQSSSDKKAKGKKAKSDKKSKK